MSQRSERRERYAEVIFGSAVVRESWRKVLNSVIDLVDDEIADARWEDYQKSRCGHDSKYGYCNRRRGHRGNHMLRMGEKGFGFAWLPDESYGSYVHNRDGEFGEPVVLVESEPEEQR